MNNPGDEPLTTGMKTRSEIEVSQAVLDCAHKCMENDDVRACAEAYAIALISDGWTSADAREVRIGAMKVLAALTGDGSHLNPDAD